MTARLLHELEIRLARGLHADAAAAGLREATARVLLALREGEVVIMSEVAQRVGRDPSTATRFVDRAVADGLLERTRGAKDRRRRVVTFTPAGLVARSRLAEIRTARAEALTAATLDETGLGLEQLEWFLQSLLKALTSQP
jgi:DNA-binding MarR family transcriptional regulator